MKTSLERAIKCLLPPPLVLGDIVVLVHFWKTINVVHYTGGLRVLEDGDSKSEKSSCRWYTYSFLHFSFWRGKGGREFQHGATRLQTPEGFNLIRFLKSPHYYLSSHTAEEKSSKNWREDNRKNPFTWTLELPFMDLKPVNAVNFPCIFLLQVK